MVAEKKSSFMINIIVGFLAVVAQQVMYKVYVGRQSLIKDSFPESDYTVTDIPTIYYSSGNIKEVLPVWNHEGFQLYRLHPGETFEFDHMAINSTVRAKTLANDCSRQSILCKPCFNETKMVTTVDTTTVFNEPGWYASFAKIADKAVENMWNMIKLPFNVEDTELEHAFISNLKESMITAAIHANPMTSSMAIQFVGKKTWLFFPADSYIGGMGSVPAAPILLPRHAPTAPFKLYVYTSQPGDVLFFPESWAHVVLTYAGPNVMVNYRNFHIKNILRQPFTWLTGTFNMIAFPQQMHSGGKAAGGELQNQAVPEKKLNFDAYTRLNEMCDGGLTKFDEQMLRVLREEQRKHE